LPKWSKVFILKLSKRNKEEELIMRDTFQGLSLRDLEILDVIHKRGPTTKKDIQILKNMKLTTLNRVMRTLQDKKLITEIGTVESTGGRKAVEYDIVKSGVYIIGIDISRIYITLVIVNLKMTILKKEEIFMDDSFSPEKVVEKLNNLIEKILLELSISKEQVLGIGIGTVGPLDREKGILINPKGFFNKHWVNVQLKDMMQRKISIPCFIDNGANTAILAESLFGEGKYLKSIVYIHCGIGIRSAMINEGSIIRAMNDSEDAFAHMIVDSGGEKCVCGNRGCIESYASIESIYKKFMLMTKDNKIKGIKKYIREEDYKKILDLAIENNKPVADIINKGAEILGIGLANLVRILNPQLIILCGPLIKNYDLYYDRCIEAFYKNNCLNNKVIFTKGGKYKEDAMVMGACLMVIGHYLKNNGLGV
jgi:predicted NBD/HSP70 family sugar kinase